MSSGWKRLYPKPAGSLPGGIVTQWGVALITVLILVFVAIWLATGAIGGGQVTMDEALLLAGPSPETGRAYTQQEFELRERLRLEALERRSRSLRS